MDAGGIQCSTAVHPGNAAEAEAAVVDASYEEVAYVSVAARYCWLLAMLAEVPREVRAGWAGRRKQTHGGVARAGPWAR